MKKALLLLMMGVLFISCGEKKDPMAETKAKNLASFQGFDTAMTAGKIDDLGKYVDDNFVDHTPMPGQKPGLEGLKEVMKMMKTSMPDAKWNYSNVWAEGDYVIGHYTMSGTMTGDMGPMKATGKTMKDIGGVDIIKFKDGKATEHWGYTEEMKMMTQMGMMPPMDGAGAPPPADSAKAEEGKKEEKK